jgi:hypothetical protein
MLREGAMPGRVAGRACLLVGRCLLIVLRVVVKVVAGALIVVIVALLLGFVAWDVLVFQPQRPQIDQLIASATEEERDPPEAVVQLVRAASFQRVALKTYWILVSDPTNPTNEAKPMSSLRWHTRGLLWWLCLSLHLSEREQIALIVSRSYMGQGMRGYSAASQALFNRPLSSLSIEEAATIVALYPAPNYYHARPEALAQRRDWLLSKLQAHQ